VGDGLGFLRLGLGFGSVPLLVMMLVFGADLEIDFREAGAALRVLAALAERASS
jgi:hypothetical protein